MNLYSIYKKNRPPEHNISLFLLVLSILAAHTIYQLGLPGGFIFDDTINLQALESYGEIQSFTQLQLYLSNAFSGPTGRPISMLSFLIDSSHWPNNPSAFKYTNIILHLVNGLLVFILFRLLFASSPRLKAIQYGSWIALLAAVWWMLHPLHVSTVLYIVQRMAVLATLFTLLGLIGYTYGRSQLSSNASFGYLVMGFSLTFFTIFATLSKENGVLLPMLTLIIEGTLFFNFSKPSIQRKFTMTFLWLPSIAIISYLIWIGITSPESTKLLKGFSSTERLLIESRIILEYLWLIVIPNSQMNGLFQNHSIDSNIWVNPIIILSSLTVTTLATAAFLLRKTVPLFSVAILFFFSAHLIESTVVPLDLYYEHRNYLASMFIFLPAAHFLLAALPYSPKGVITLACVITLFLSVLLLDRASLWSDNSQLHLAWAEKNPTSHRAQLAAAEVLLNNKSRQKAQSLLESSLSRVENHIPIRLHLMRIYLQDGKNIVGTMLKISTPLKSVPYSNETIIAMRMLSEQISINSDRTNATAMIELWDNLAKNEAFTIYTKHLASIKNSKGALYLAENNLHSALKYFREALVSYPSLSLGLRQAAALATQNRHCAALQHLSFIKSIALKDSKYSSNRVYFKKELKALVKAITKSAREKKRKCDYSLKLIESP